MRFTIASVAIMAGAVAAVPQYGVQPISQISDGQIQAPPATSAVGSAVPLPSPSDVSVPAGVTSALSSAVGDITSTLAVTETASVTSAIVVPTATPIAPSGSMVTPIVGGNSTASATGSAAVSASTPSSEESATSGVAGSSTGSASVPESTGAAAGNMVSFGGLVFAIGAAVFA